MEYYHFFRMAGSPFQPASPKTAVYMSPTHLQGLSTLEAGLMNELTGLTMLTGEAGTGKTTLIYALLQRDYKRVRIAHIEDPKLSFLEMMRVIMPQLNLYASGTTKLDYLNTLDHLLELHGHEERIAIIVDEAQVVSDEVLEELRLLSNRAQRNERCLQLILVGQPELAERLKKPELRQLNQRISTRGTLEPFDLRRSVMYVEFLITAQGGKCSEIFEDGALERLLKPSDGIPRKINMLCHTAMQGAFFAGERKVTVRRAKKTAAEYHDSVAIAPQRSQRKFVSREGVALAVILVLGLAYMETDGVLKPVVSQVVQRSIQTASRVARRHRGSQPPDQAKVATEAPRPAERPAEVAPPVAPPAPIQPLAAPRGTIPGSAPIAAAGLPSVQPISADQKGNEAQNGRRRIIVRQGDTLEKIAIRYYGSDAGLNSLIDANPHLADINQLTVGEVLYLPATVNAAGSGGQTEADR